VRARRSRRRGVLLVLAAVAGLVAACGPSPGGASPGTAGCPTDSRAPGALPDLEALLPKGMIERSPDSVDSGVNCTTRSLGTYSGHGVAALGFAGATWNLGRGDATVVAILTTAATGPPLQASWVEEFYETGARQSTKTENIEVTRPTMAGAGQVYRLETLNELSLQTVVVWPAGRYVHVVIVATQVAPGASRDDHDRRVGVAVEVAAGVPIV
jgi:FtsP/CotA-like multicopper oxidase with cupredoxin domain